MLFHGALGVVFLIAGCTKLSVPGWAATTATAMGVPLPATRLVPAAELVLGAAIVARVPYTPAAAIVMLVAYTAVLVPRVGGPPCACFGRAAKPITWLTVARNVAFIALAVVTLFA